MNDTASLFDTEALLSDGIKSTPPSFVRSILKAASDPTVTSFAGGLPNPISFPEDELLKSMERVVAEQGPNAFQYSSTAGIDELRQWVADRYNKRFGTDYVLDDVLITTGSQQILDLLGQVHASGTTLVMVTHDAQVAVRADRVLVLVDGRIVEDLSLGRYEEAEAPSRLTTVTEALQRRSV